MASNPTCLIIGGGVIGAAIANQLSRSHHVTIVDAGIDADNASQGSLAWLNACTSADADYARLREKSLALWRALAAEQGCPVRMDGSLMWGGDMGETARFLTGLGLNVEHIGPEAFRTFAPGVATPPTSTLYAPDEGMADPLKITDWLLQRAGAEMIKGTVAALIQDDNRVTGAVLTDGQRLTADEVVVAAGCGTPALMAPLGVSIAMKSAPGVLIHTSPVPHQTTPVLATPELDFWQRADGRMLIATGVDAYMTGAVEDAVASALDALHTLMPGVKGVTAEQVITRNRPIPADGFPALGRPDGVAGVFAIATHSGMTLAPIIAEAVAADLSGAPAPHDLRPYAIQRDYGASEERRLA